MAQHLGTDPLITESSRGRERPIKPGEYARVDDNFRRSLDLDAGALTTSVAIFFGTAVAGP